MEQERLSSQIRKFVFSWHNLYIDYWWRKKYNVPFGSPQHRAMSLIDMSIEYIEDNEIKKAIRARERAEERELDEYTGASVTSEEIDEDYDNIDIDDL